MSAEGLALEVDMKTVDGMFIKQISVPRRGTLIPQHVHVWDHSTLLAAGRIVWWREGVPQYFVAPAIIEVPAGMVHEFQTLEDNTLLYCIHNFHAEGTAAVLAEHHLDADDLKLGAL